MNQQPSDLEYPVEQYQQAARVEAKQALLYGTLAVGGALGAYNEVHEAVLTAPTPVDVAGAIVAGGLFIVAGAKASLHIFRSLANRETVKRVKQVNKMLNERSENESH